MSPTQKSFVSRGIVTGIKSEKFLVQKNELGTILTNSKVYNAVELLETTTRGTVNKLCPVSGKRTSNVFNQCNIIED